jgi:hypothetical protein
MSWVWGFLNTLAPGAVLLILARWAFAWLVRQAGYAMLPELIWIKMMSWFLGLGFFSQTLRGKCRIEWTTKSPSFDTRNSVEAEVWNSGGSIAIVGVGHKSGAKVADYVFIGKLQDRVVTGSWHDKRDRKLGYHGAFQFILKPDLKHCSGKWIGYSSRADVVDEGTLTLVMLN